MFQASVHILLRRFVDGLTVIGPPTPLRRNYMTYGNPRVLNISHQVVAAQGIDVQGIITAQQGNKRGGGGTLETHEIHTSGLSSGHRSSRRHKDMEVSRINHFYA